MRKKAKKRDQKQLGKSVHKDAKAAMSVTKNSDITKSSQNSSFIDPFDERLMRICGRPKDPTAEESALAFAEKEFDLKRKHWQLERDQEEWAIKKRSVTLE